MGRVVSSDMLSLASGPRFIDRHTGQVRLALGPLPAITLPQPTLLYGQLLALGTTLMVMHRATDSDLGQSKP